MHEAVAKAKMEEMKKNIAETWFAWSGPTEKGSAAYFRIQGPTVLIEYAPQRMGGDATKAHPHDLPRPDERVRSKMVEAVTTTLRRLPLLLALLALPSAVSRHRLDEYLQATLVAIEPGDIRLQINLTPGVDVAEQVLALIDRDRDGVISTNEAAAYAEVLKRDLTASRWIGRKVRIETHRVSIPRARRTPHRLGNHSDGILRDARSARGRSAQAHPREPASPPMSVYLFNAAQPKSGTVQITRQKRNDNQSTGEIDFTFHPSARP